MKIIAKDSCCPLIRDEVRDHAWEWMIDYNEERPHDALGKIPPTIYRKKMEQISTLELSA